MNNNVIIKIIGFIVFMALMTAGCAADKSQNDEGSINAVDTLDLNIGEGNDSLRALFRECKRDFSTGHRVDTLSYGQTKRLLEEVYRDLKGQASTGRNKFENYLYRLFFQYCDSIDKKIYFVGDSVAMPTSVAFSTDKRLIPVKEQRVGYNLSAYLVSGTGLVLYFIQLYEEGSELRTFIFLTKTGGKWSIDGGSSRMICLKPDLYD